MDEVNQLVKVVILELIFCHAVVVSLLSVLAIALGADHVAKPFSHLRPKVEVDVPGQN